MESVQVVAKVWTKTKLRVAKNMFLDENTHLYY